MMNVEDMEGRNARRTLMGGAKFLGAFALFLATACGGRPEKWEVSLGPAPVTVGLNGSIAVQDAALDRVLFVSATADGELLTQPYTVGKDVSAIQASTDGEQLMVLSRGDVPRVDPDDEPPQLLVFDGDAGIGSEGRLIKSFELDDPMRKLSLDPLGEWVLAFDGEATVTNLNELVLCNLEGNAQEGTPVSKTIRSFGGAPIDVTFTEELTVPEGPPRRFLAVRTDRDVALIDLSDLEAEEVTIPLPTDESDSPQTPAEIIYDDGDPADPEDARLAIRLDQSSDVVLVELGAPKEAGRDFSVVMNIVDVGGVPSTIDFVRTDGGLRLAALVPSRQRATLVNPETTLAEVVELPRAYSSMRRVTADVEGRAEDGDVALLWGSSSSIAFWTLGTSSSTPFRSVASTELSFAVTEVLDVPPPNQHLKVLRSDSSRLLYLLDLEKRQSFPFSTKLGTPQVRVAPDGKRMWVYQPGSGEFSSVRLSDMHPRQLTVSPRVGEVFDLAQRGSGRAAVVLHYDAGLGGTLLSASDPDPTQTSFFPALHLRGL